MRKSINKMMFCVYFMLLVFLVKISPGSAQISAQIPVPLPTHAYIMLAIDSRILVLDVYDGSILVVAVQEQPRPMRFPLFNALGTDIAFTDPGNVKIARDFWDTNNISTIYTFDPQIGGFRPQSWSIDGETILGITSGSVAGGHEVQLLNIQNGSFTTLRRYEDSLPLIEDPNLKFFTIDRADWNPVLKEWVAIQLAAFPVRDDEADKQEQFDVAVNLVFNHVTGATLLLNDVLDEKISPSTAPIWSPNGRYLLTETIDVNGTKRINILEFQEIDNSGKFSVIKLGEIERGGVVHWLGVQDLLIERTRDNNAYDVRYNIVQIIKNHIFRKELITIDLRMFSQNPAGEFLQGSWNLRADENERQQISCLFDHAQPSRFNIGDRARVNFTAGIPLPLREAPDLESSQIMQMAEGTEFEVLAGPACFNASDYYRFWQIELSDGTIGWATEAGMAGYFMEPVLATPIPTDPDMYSGKKVL